MTSRQINVWLAPNKSVASFPPNTTWPMPAGIKVTLTNPGDDKDVHHVTAADPSLGKADLRPGVSYEVAITDGQWKGAWEPAHRTLTVPGTAKPRDPVGVILVPREDDHWLVALGLHRQRPDGPPVAGAKVRTEAIAGGHHPSAEFPSLDDGSVYLTAPRGTIALRFRPVTTAADEEFIPWDDCAHYTVRTGPEVDVTDIVYLNAVRLSVKPEVQLRDGKRVPLTGAIVTVAYHGSALARAYEEKPQTLAQGQDTVDYTLRFPGKYETSVEPPAVIGGWPVVPGAKSLPPLYAGPGGIECQPACFDTQAAESVDIDISTPSDQGLDRGLELDFHDYRDIHVSHNAGTGGRSRARVPEGTPLSIRVGPNATPTIDGIPVKMTHPDQRLERATASNPRPVTTIELEYEHAITGDAVDRAGRPAPRAVIDVRDDRDNLIRHAAADDSGHFTVGLKRAGDYFVAVHTTDGGMPAVQVSVHSVVPLPRPLVVESVPRDTESDVGRDGRRPPREAVTDLSSYPVLTEEVPTGGGFPGRGGPGPGGGYGTSVEQVMRDVLGWRPSKDVAGFQAALAGAFELREVPGHTEVTWQQRGYSVQADMGAVTGAQASIYARARNAHDQVKPLLAGLTSLDPSVSTDEEREAVRAVVTAELTELVSELSLEGGPRAQRVDELFTLLTGQDSRNEDVSLDPDRVGGQLRILRERFALTDDNVDTIDNERVQTSFRIIVEQVLALQAGWAFDRGLLVISQGSSLGTLLISLSRGLEAVGDSLDELDFALNSVFIDAAQRQVVELRFAEITIILPDLPLSRGTTTEFTFPDDEPSMRLSDLLDWVGRATRDEGPRLIQDTGRDGVAAFAPVLDQLRRLVRATRVIADDRTDGLRTSRVLRALDVLTGQLDEAADFAELVRPPADEQNSY